MKGRKCDLRNLGHFWLVASSDEAYPWKHKWNCHWYHEWYPLPPRHTIIFYVNRSEGGWKMMITIHPCTHLLISNGTYISNAWLICSIPNSLYSLVAEGDCRCRWILGIHFQVWRLLWDCSRNISRADRRRYIFVLWSSEDRRSYISSRRNRNNPFGELEMCLT